MPRHNHKKSPPPRPQPRHRCVGKLAYATKITADKAAHKLQQLHDSDTPNRSYICSDCGKWHLTSAS